MPWCEECAKYWTPNAMREDGTCPKCGDDLAEQVSPAAQGSAARTSAGADRSGTDTSTIAQDDEAVDESVPWHFKLMVAMVALYLGWRVVELFI